MENSVIELSADVTLAKSILICSALCAIHVSAQELHSHPVPEKLGTVFHQLWSPPDPADLRKGLAETGQAGLHAMDYLTYAYLQRGRDADAERVGAALRVMAGLLGKDFKVGYAATAIPVRLTIGRRGWGDAALL